MADTQLLEVGKIKSLRFGTVGADGAMATLTASDEYNEILSGTISVAFDPPSESNIMVETSDNPYYIAKKGAVKSFTLELLGLKLSEVPMFMGGTFTPASGVGEFDTYAAPIDVPDIILACEFETADSNAGAGIYQFVKLDVVASQTGNWTSDALRGLELKCTILQPYNDLGVATSPRYIKGAAYSA